MTGRQPEALSVTEGRALQSEQDLELFRELIAARMGLRFEDDKLALLRDVLHERQRATRSAAPVIYFDRLASDSPELGELARVLSVPETYFLRNADQFLAIREWFRTRAYRSPKARFRVLSAGCATGEEPYSVAMVAEEVLGSTACVSITGVDVNPDALHKARRGRYTTWSLREVPAPVVERYFQRDGSDFVLEARLRDSVEFAWRNLTAPDPEFWKPELFDLVLCRNVLMYLTPEAARGIVHRIAESLVPGGLLFLGHAENLRGLSSDFHLHHQFGTFFYERRGSLTPQPVAGIEAEAPEPPPLPGGSWVEAIRSASSRIAELVSTPSPAPKPEVATSPRTMDSALELMQLGRADEALRRLEMSTGARDVDRDALLLRAVLLTSGGNIRAAEQTCERLLAEDELNAGAHYVLALCRENGGDLEAAIEHDRTALYLDADFSMPHLHLGLIARRRRDLLTAHRELKLALGLLARDEPSRVMLFGGGFGREGLLQLCRTELKALEGGGP